VRRGFGTVAIVLNRADCDSFAGHEPPEILISRFSKIECRANSRKRARVAAVPLARAFERLIGTQQRIVRAQSAARRCAFSRGSRNEKAPDYRPRLSSLSI